MLNILKMGLLGSLLVISNAVFSGGARIAVMDFENRSQHGGYRVGRGAADILTTELVKSTDFDIFERSRLASIMTEQDMSNSGRFDSATAAKIGKLAGVQYVVTGAVTEYGESSSGISGGGMFSAGKKGYFAGVDVRVIDVNSGKILFADSGQGKKASTNVKVMGFGGGEKWNEKHATAALRNAIEDISKKLASAELKGGPAAPVDILVADVDGSIVMFNKGSEAGLSVGETLTVKRQGKVIKDPATGKVLKVRYNTVGKVKLTAVESGFSEGNIVSGSSFTSGDIASK
jgi:curli biogenesis system outer membrane secretion channel CsgG